MEAALKAPEAAITPDEIVNPDGGAKRRQILDGARAVFLQDGFDGASMNDVARAAGVARGDADGGARRRGNIALCAEYRAVDVAPRVGRRLFVGRLGRARDGERRSEGDEGS